MRNRPASPHRRKRAVWADRVTQPGRKAPAAKPAPLTGRDLDIAVAKAMGYRVTNPAGVSAAGYGLTPPGQPDAVLYGTLQRSEALAWENVPAFSTDAYHLKQMTDWLLRQRCGPHLSQVDEGWYCTVWPRYDSPLLGCNSVLTKAPGLPEVVSRAIVELAGQREAKEEESLD